MSPQLTLEAVFYCLRLSIKRAQKELEWCVLLQGFVHGFTTENLTCKSHVEKFIYPKALPFVIGIGGVCLGIGFNNQYFKVARLPKGHAKQSKSPRMLIV